MTFTALHRALGERPGPITDEMIDAAVAAQLPETAELDWKRRLPDVKALRDGDFPKDVAAMANGPGGVIVYGVQAEGKRAARRFDAGELSEQYERAMYQAAFNRIEPPVLDLTIHSLGADEQRVVVVEVRPSPDAPHLIPKYADFFGAPLRNDADTVWMRERQLEKAYRARLEERRRVTESLQALHQEAEDSQPKATRCWFVGVSRPHTPRPRGTLHEQEVQDILLLAANLTKSFAKYANDHPLAHVNKEDLRPGLRRWVAPSVTSRREWPSHREAWISVHHDGSVTVVAAVGEALPARARVDAAVIECAIADLMVIVRETAAATSNPQYDIRVGMSWNADEPLRILSHDHRNRPDDTSSTPLHRFIPLDLSVDADAPVDEYRELTRELAMDCVNQGGVHQLYAMKKPSR